MKAIDGNDIKCLLGKRGYSLTDVARDLDVTPVAVHWVIWGAIAAQRISAHIERLLDMKPGTLRIKKVKQICRSRVDAA